METSRCYTVKDLQEMLGISRPTVYGLLQKKEFSWVKINGYYKISKRSFDEWLDHNFDHLTEKLMDEPKEPDPADEKLQTKALSERFGRLSL